MGQDGRVFVMPTHIDAILREHLDSFVQPGGIPVLTNFIIGERAMQQPPKVGIFQRHIIPEDGSSAMFHSKVTDLFEPDHLQFKSCFSGRFTTFVYADCRYFISTDMKLLAVRHGFHRIPVKIKL